MKFRIKNHTIPLLLIACVSLMASPVMADGLTAQQIVDKSLERNKFGFQNAIADITLKLVSKRGSERVREVQIKSIEREGLGKSLVRFHAPADVAGTGFLLIEKADADDDQYLYLPALGKVKRITGSQRNQRFMPQHQVISSLGWRAVDEGTDLPIRSADTDIQRLDLDLRGGGDFRMIVVDYRDLFLFGPDTDRSHFLLTHGMRSPTDSFRRRARMVHQGR